MQRFVPNSMARRSVIPAVAGGLWRNRRGIARGIRASRYGYNVARNAISQLSQSTAGSMSSPPSRSNLRGREPIRQGSVHNEGTGGQYSEFVLSLGKSSLPKHIEDVLPPQCVVANAASQGRSTVGKQSVVAPMQLFGPALCTTYTGDKISRVLYQKASGDVTLNNIYLSNCYVIIYDIIARRDSSSNAISTPLASWVQGDVDESVTGYELFLGSTPWQSEAFNQFWQVKQVTNVVLGAGATHVHKVRLTENKIISAARAQYNNGMLEGCTYWTMVEFHGSPANDVTTQTQVSVGVGGLNIIVDQEQHLKQLSKNTPTVSASNTLLTSFTVGEQVVNLGGSTIQANALG
jgi:hypothetical protein